MTAKRTTKEPAPDVEPAAEPTAPSAPEFSAYIGQTVFYQLTASDAQRITARRSAINNPAYCNGNPVNEGQLYPAIVTAVGATMVNAQVILDGDDNLWVTSVHEGEAPGQFCTTLTVSVV